MIFDIEEITIENLCRTLANEFDLEVASCLVRKRNVFISLKVTFKDGTLAFDSTAYSLFRNILNLKNLTTTRVLNSKGKYSRERVYFSFPIFEEGDENYCFLYDLFRTIKTLKC